LFFIRHRSEQLRQLVGNRQKVFVLIEAARTFNLDVDDHREGCILVRHCSKEGTRQQKPTMRLVLMTALDRETAEKGLPE
jgi:hypothetical protein